MTNSTLVVMAVAVVAVSLLALATVLIVCFNARGPARAGLASLGTTAALTGPVAGIGAASYGLIEHFQLVASSPGGMSVVLAGCAQTALLIRIGCVAAAVTLLVASPLGWIGRGQRPALPFASAGRLVVLALPAVMAFLVVGGALELSRRTRNTIIEVVTEPAPSPAAAAADTDPAAEEAPPPSQAGSIAEISQRISIGLMTGVLGVPFLLLVLAGFAVATAILAWRVQVPTAFAALSSAWMVAQAGLWLAAVFLFRTPAPPA